MIIGTLMALETCQVLGQRFHTIYFIGRETSRRIHVVREEIDEKTAYIQARTSMARALEVNGKARKVEGEAKVVQ